MSSQGNYRINPETLMYEFRASSGWKRFFKVAATFLASVALALFLFWFVAIVLGRDLPKTLYLKRQNIRWTSRIEVMNRRLDQYEAVLSGLEKRDEDIYRSIFGMDSIPSRERNAGLVSASMLAAIEAEGGSGVLQSTASRLGGLAKKATVQSSSFDEVGKKASLAGDMASCIPAILPMMPGRFVLTSPFGYRTDPINGTSKMHTGMDFSCPPGNPVYATGDGVVESVQFEFFGYGNHLVIDHGFGYKTHYAHMKTINVVENMKVKRGDQIGESGKSGRATGPHLHYEVFYRDAFVNPANFLDTTMPAEEYQALIRKREEEHQEVLGQPFSLRRRQQK
ncbi:MAG: M23 family metallopeptidase [Bacteroidales bacterium]|jgi:murein DD-endopeptidase MepM/ murein hydrolase activator NlpD|nr:M23 family metallopeptidase [Bacteroidales bacterium]